MIRTNRGAVASPGLGVGKGVLEGDVPSGEDLLRPEGRDDDYGAAVARPTHGGDQTLDHLLGDLASEVRVQGSPRLSRCGSLPASLLVQIGRASCRERV